MEDPSILSLIHPSFFIYPSSSSSSVPNKENGVTSRISWTSSVSIKTHSNLDNKKTNFISISDSSKLHGINSLHLIRSIIKAYSSPIKYILILAIFVNKNYVNRKNGVSLYFPLFFLFVCTSDMLRAPTNLDYEYIAYKMHSHHSKRIFLSIPMYYEQHS